MQHKLLTLPVTVVHLKQIKVILAHLIYNFYNKTQK